jgi:protein tyrosine phosphatase (PTP) superfamily phosphohydrolase (DUF442 family)
LIHKLIFVVIFLAAYPLASADELSDISNYRQYSELFSSAGQPTALQLEKVEQQGFERVIYLAFTDDHTAIEDEDRVVKQLGMDYVHIPVDWENPTLADFKTFADVMGNENTVKTFLHCQVNFRASSFSFLYRVAIQSAPVLDAKEDLDSVWAPNETWFRFIRTVLADYNLSPACKGCDWGSNEFID